MADYDLVVIGSGPAGEKGAAQAAYFGIGQRKVGYFRGCHNCRNRNQDKDDKIGNKNGVGRCLNKYLKEQEMKGRIIHL